MSKRVVVTGIGIISSLGLVVASTWQGIVNSRSGVDYITLFDAGEFGVKIAAEVKGFDPCQYIDRKRARRMDRFTQFAIAASLEASESARLKIDRSNGYDVGVIIGSCMGGLTTLSGQFEVLASDGPSQVGPFLIPMMLADMASGQV